MNQESSTNNLSAIVLAAGQSRRTSPHNKLLLPFHNSTVIQTVLDKIVELNFAEVLVVTGSDEAKIREALKDYRVRFVHNHDYKQGMTTSIKTGVANVKADVDGFMIFLGDMPWIDQGVINMQIQSFYTNPQAAIVVMVFQRRQGNPVIFAQKYKSKLSGLSGDSGARSIIKKHEEQVIEVQIPNQQMLFDIDTWEDYKNLK